MGFSHWVHLSVQKVVKETAAAFLLLLEEGEIWVPKSQIADAEDYAEGDVDCEVSVTEWWAQKNGLI